MKTIGIISYQTPHRKTEQMVLNLAERYHLVHCEENYHLDTILSVANPENQPNISYVNTKPSWQHFVNRTPDEYEAWVDGNNLELAEFEVAELIRLSAEQKVIVDTNIPCELLWQISDYNHVAILLSPQSMSVERFFEREDEEKQFLHSVIRSCPDPEKTLDNFKQCIARVNSPERYEAFRNSGFYTLIRQNNMADTREEMLSALAGHFQLT